MLRRELLQYSESDRQDILRKFDRTPENVCQDIGSIKEWFAKQPHLPEIPDDKLIENFLLMNKFHIEETKRKLDMYYSIRSLIPEFYDKDPNSALMQQTMNVIYTTPLPKLTKDLHRVIIAAKIKDSNPDHFDASAFMAHSYNLVEIRLREDCHAAMIYVIDFANIEPAHLMKFTLTHLKKSSFIAQNVLTNRMHAVHLLNAPAFADSFLMRLKSFLKQKMANRIYIHKTMDTFYKIIPKEILPKDFGGTEKSLEELNEGWRKVLLNYDSLYKHLHSIKVNEKLRPGKPLASDILGIQGNFRQLEVD